MARIAPKPSPVSSAFEKAIAGRAREAKSAPVNPGAAMAAKAAALSTIQGIKGGQNIQGTYQSEGKRSVTGPFQSLRAAQAARGGKGEVVFTPRGNTSVARGPGGKPLPMKGK